MWLNHLKTFLLIKHQHNHYYLMKTLQKSQSYNIHIVHKSINDYMILLNEEKTALLTFLIWRECREEKNLIFCFGTQFNSTLNFTQSGWLILFSPDLHFWLAKRVSGQTHSSAWDGDQNRRVSGRPCLAMLFS